MEMCTLTRVTRYISPAKELFISSSSFNLNQFQVNTATAHVITSLNRIIPLSLFLPLSLSSTVVRMMVKTQGHVQHCFLQDGEDMLYSEDYLSTFDSNA